jgi:small subunit ribosomal protein S11
VSNGFVREGLAPPGVRNKARFSDTQETEQQVAKEPQNAGPDTPAKPAAGGKAGAAAPAKRKKEFKKKRERRVVPHGIVHVAATFNNTQITITDTDGRTMCWSSAGAIGFKGSRKGTPYAAQQASLAAAGVARDQYGMKSVEVKVQGPGSGRESAVRALAAAGLHIVVIRDVTPIPHNGCRPPKRRRV